MDQRLYRRLLWEVCSVYVVCTFDKLIEESHSTAEKQSSISEETGVHQVLSTFFVSSLWVKVSKLAINMVDSSMQDLYGPKCTILLMLHVHCKLQYVNFCWTVMLMMYASTLYKFMQEP